MSVKKEQEVRQRLYKFEQRRLKMLEEEEKKKKQQKALEAEL